MDAPPCFGLFWDGIPESDCSRCRMSDDCLKKFAGDALRALQARLPGGPPERWAAEVGVSPAGMRLAMGYQQRQEIAAGAVPPAITSGVAEPMPLPPMVNDRVAVPRGVDPAEEAPEAQSEVDDMPRKKPGDPPKKRGRPIGAASKKKEVVGKVAPEPEPAPRLLPGEVVDFKKGKARKPRPKKGDAGNFPVAGAAKPAAAPVVVPAGLVPCAEGLAGEPKRWVDPGVQKRWSPAHDLKRWEREQAKNLWLAKLPLGTRMEAHHKGRHYEAVKLRGKYVCLGWWFPTLYCLTKAIVGAREYARRSPEISIGSQSKGTRTLTSWNANRLWKVRRMLEKRNFHAPKPTVTLNGPSGKSS